MMRKLKYYVAISVDGFIAHEDGSFEGFPWDEEVVADFLDSLGQFDTVLMGRKTYEVGLKEGKTSPYPAMKQYLFSRTMATSPDAQVELISENAVDVVATLKQAPGTAIWLCGGADLATTLLAAGLIDEVILKVNPVLFGAGISLFSKEFRPTTLTLIDSKIYRGGTALLSYGVNV